MRILVISNYFPPFELGGWEQLTLNVVDRLRARGHELEVLTSNYRMSNPAKAEAHVRRTLHTESPDHLHYPPQAVLLYRLRNRQNRRAFDRLAASFRPDLVFINGMWNLSRDLPRHVEARFPGRVAYYIASHWPAERDAHNSYWNLPAGRQAMQPLKTWVSRLLEKRADLRPVLAFEHVFFVSAFMRDHLAQAVGGSPDRLRVIYNGVEPEQFTFCQRDIGGRPLRLLYAGQVSLQKGAHVALQAFVAFTRRNPEFGASLTMIGGGSPEFIAALEKTIVDDGVSDRVAFRPPVPREAMPALLAEHDVLLFPSIWAEPLSRLVQEAMASGLVVIGTATGGTGELLRHGETGLIFRSGDAFDLVLRLEELAAQPDLFSRLALHARRTVEEDFTMETMVSRLESSFAAIVGRA